MKTYLISIEGTNYTARAQSKGKRKTTREIERDRALLENPEIPETALSRYLKEGTCGLSILHTYLV